MRDRLSELGSGRFASLVERFYAMDRDHRWPRIQTAYELITDGRARFRAADPLAALEMACGREETDEFIEGTCIWALL